MATKEYSTFERFMQRVASSRAGARFLAPALHRLDRIVLKLSGGKTTMTSILGGLPVVYVTATGANSGLPRSLPLIFIQDRANSDSFALIASNYGQRHNPAWYYNLKANPRAQCAIAGQTEEYIAHEAEGEEYDRYWQAAADTYIGYPLYKQRAAHRRIPIMVMTPAKE